MRPTAAVFAFVAAVAMPSAIHGQATNRIYAGLIRNIVGHCTLTRPGGDAKTLGPASAPKRLYVDDVLACDKDSYMLIELTSDSPKDSAKKRENADRGTTSVEPGETLKVPHVALARGDGLSPAVEALEAAAPSRADHADIFAPADDEYIRPRDFVVRFASDTGAALFSIVLNDRRGRPLWNDDGVHPESGAVIADGAREALARYRDDGGGMVTMYLTATNGRRSQVDFDLLSRDEEKRLDTELAFCDANAREIMLPLCRIAAYERARSYNDVAAAYDAALALAPESEDLLDNALIAHQRVGNVKRVDALKAQLSKSH